MHAHASCQGRKKRDADEKAESKVNTVFLRHFVLQTRVPIRWMAVESLFNNTYTTQSDV